MKLVLCTVGLVLVGAAVLTARTRFAPVHSTSTPVLTFADDTVLRPSPYKIGLNIGVLANYDSSQLMKNLLGEDNAGFEPLRLTQILYANSAGTATSFTSSDIYSATSLNRFAGATFTVVESSSAAKGCAGKITGSTTGSNDGSNPIVFTLGTACAAPIGSGDEIVVRLLESPTAESAWESGQNNVGCTNYGGLARITSDVSAPYDGAQSLVVDTSAKGAGGQCGFYFNNMDMDQWVMLNGTYTVSIAAKALSGSATIELQVGGCKHAFQPAPNVWRTYTFDCALSNGKGGLSVLFYGAGVNEIDDVVLQKTSGQDPLNTTVFRDEVVNTFKSWCGGSEGAYCVIRNWTYANGETMDNWTRPALSALLATSGTAQQTSLSSTTPRLQDYLKLVEILHGIPYVAVPVTFSTQDAANLIDFLESTDVSSGYGKIRAALGQKSPWVGPNGVFPEIYLSFGNENWNRDFIGQNLPGHKGAANSYTDYATRSASIFSAMRADSAFVAGATHLGCNLQIPGNAVSTAGDLRKTLLPMMAAMHGAPDYFELAPYTSNTVSNWHTDAALWGSALEEPYDDVMNASSLKGYRQAVTELMALNGCGPSGNTACMVDNYEQGAGTLQTCPNYYDSSCGGPDSNNAPIDQPSADRITAGAGQGIVAPLQALLNLQYLGVGVQNYFGLDGYSNAFVSGTNHDKLRSKIYGVVVDMGGASSMTNAQLFGGSFTPRPAMLGMMLINRAIVGPMFSCTINGVPAYDWAGDPYNGPTHALKGVPSLYSFCFKDSVGNRSLVLINTNLSDAYTLTFAGTHPPAGSVSVVSFNPPSLDSMNEAPTGDPTGGFKATVSNTASTLVSPLSFTVPAHSVATLKWTVLGVLPAPSPR